MTELTLLLLIAHQTSTFSRCKLAFSVCIRLFGGTKSSNFGRWCSPLSRWNHTSSEKKHCPTLFPEFVSRNNHLQKFQRFGKSCAFNSYWRLMGYGCLCKTTNALCIVVLERFRLGTHCLVETEGIASTLSRISSTLPGSSALFSYLIALYRTECLVWNLFMIPTIVDLFGGVTSVNSPWNNSWTSVYDVGQRLKIMINNQRILFFCIPHFHVACTHGYIAWSKHLHKCGEQLRFV